jgi:hypothetical protein
VRRTTEVVLRSAFGLALVSVLVGCESETLDIFVDLRTDWVPVVEFARVETELTLASREGEARVSSFDVEPGADFIDGERIAELRDIPPGDHPLSVRLFTEERTILASQRLVLSVRRSFGTVVLITRACGLVDCPGPADPPHFTQCLDGVCVDERCTDSTPEYCPPPRCRDDTECVPELECAVGICVRGVCAYPPDDSMCEAEIETCDPSSGCQLLPGLVSDVPVACADWAPGAFDACALPAPTLDLVLDRAGVWEYDTNREELTPPDTEAMSLPGTEISGALVLSLRSLQIDSPATLRVVGRRPIVLASFTTIEVDGVVDASSGGGPDGAGANASHCAMHSAGNGATDASGNSAGGGGGGGYGGGGGRGGDGVQSGRRGGGNGGGTHTLPPDTVAGGCPGGRGGDTVDGDPGTGGGGGAGGGGVALVAGRAVLLRGTVHAGGAGGNRGTAAEDAGGGGGGSGGYVGLDAPLVVVYPGAVLAANGGAGAGDSLQSTAAESGMPSDVAAVGGDAPAAGGARGGTGSAGATLEGGPGGEGGAGGCGGGGGAGIVAVRTDRPSIRDGALVSPPAI